MKYRFVIADVFAESRFGGNQLAVFTDGTGLDAQSMQDIAREMNYSETTFLFGPESGGDFKVRIFTPARELPFAGHPIVGTGYVVVSERLKKGTNGAAKVALETGVGVIEVDVATGEGLSGRATMTQPLPVAKAAVDDCSALASALSLDRAAIERTGLPIQAFYNGITGLIVPVESIEAVRSIKVDIGALERITDQVGAETVLVFTRETVRPTSTAHCRVFAPGAGVIEDPATGSANGPLGYYLVRHGLVEPTGGDKVVIVSEQGYEMKRPSMLTIEVALDPATKAPMAVRVGGGVVIAGQGEIFT